MKNVLKKIALAVFTVGAVASFSAQKIDAKAKAILDAVATNYKSKENVYFKFVYGTGSGKKVTKTEPGIFYSAKDLYKLKIMGTEQIFDGNKIYNISEEDQEVTVAKPSGSEHADYIKLTPTKNNGIKEVNLFVNAAKKQLVKIEQFSNDNAVSVIAISNYKENQKLSSTMFTFDKEQYKNYFVTEL